MTFQRLPRHVWLVLITCLVAPSCGPGDKSAAEHTAPPAVSEEAAPALIQSAEEGRALPESMLERFERADEETIRLLPRQFGNLPAAIARELERRGCTIPQVYTETGLGNVVQGQFTALGQVDIAVLCSRQRVSSILIFRNSSMTDVAELASAPDLQYLQEVGHERIGYSRALGVADAEYIRAHYAAFGGLKPPSLDHEGINDAFVGKASAVWYWYDGQWLQLTGAD